MKPTFKLAETFDLETILQLMREYYNFDHLDFHEYLARTALEQLVKDNSLGRVWLIQVEDEAIGYAVLTLGYSLEYRGRDAFVDELYIRESYRDRGIGTETLKFIETNCYTLGIRALHLEVERNNTKAQSTYRKFGFEDRDRFLMTKWISLR
jgi:GNAT superfamily N-acetyltransferase